MNKLLEKIYVKSELQFALIWIAIYCVAESLANQLSELVGINSSVTFLVNIILTLALLSWIKRRGLFEKYGLCRTTLPASRFAWYIPLGLVISHSLWNGVAVNMPIIDTICYIGSMICVGFLEEVIFRGFLFKALEKDNVKSAIIISSVTFGLGHLLNLVNGSGMELVTNLCQVVGAVTIGFLFVILFYRGGSLWPCIITHAANNAIGVFANESTLTTEKRILISAINAVIVIGYSFILIKTLPKTETQRIDLK